MSKGKITLYVDLVSPFGYMGYWILRNHPTFKDVEKTYIPFLLGGLMKMCNNTPPLMIKNKNEWINAERKRWAKQFSIPMSPTPPPGFPLPTVPIQRCLAYIALHHSSHLTSCLDVLYTAFWVRADGSITKPEGFKPLLSTILPSDVLEDVMTNYNSAEAKKLLTENTEKAMAEGAFGLPWWDCTNSKGDREAFWGVDHLGQVVQFMGLEWGEGMRALL